MSAFHTHTHTHTHTNTHLATTPEGWRPAARAAFITAVLPPTRACNSPNVGFNLVLRRLEAWFGKYAFFSGNRRILIGNKSMPQMQEAPTKALRATVPTSSIYASGSISFATGPCYKSLF